MNILFRTYSKNNQACAQCVVMFGSGLIGSQVLKQLKASNVWSCQSLPFSWNNVSRQKNERQNIFDIINQKFESDATPNKYLDFVWCAGKAGFSAEESVFEAEHNVFVKNLNMCQSLIAQYNFKRARCHLISSAGGLFEGQSLVDAYSTPNPIRPYGHAKLRMEKYIQTHSKEFISLIYRPSSVYGYSKAGSRVGLIVALLSNVIRNQESTIYGQPSTLRDFVFADDIGKFMAQKIRGEGDSPEFFTLAAGKPSSMTEVIKHIQTVADKELLLRYVFGGSNTLNNTFNNSVLPAHWQATPLEIGITKVSNRMKAHFHA